MAWALRLLRVACWSAGMAAGAGAGACELVLAEHRTDRIVARWPVQPPVRLVIRSTHSVLRTPMQDHYVMRWEGSGWRARLVEVRFAGEGYGLPHAALGPGETLERAGAGWRLRLDREVHPLVVRPTPEQDPWLEAGGRELRLIALGRNAMAVQLDGCAPPRP